MQPMQSKPAPFPSDPGASLKAAFRGRPADYALLLICLLGIGISWFWIQRSIAAGPPMAEIYHGERLLATYPIPVEGEPAVHFTAHGDLGAAEIVIDASGARMQTAPCSSQRCVLSGPHRHAGDLIACVPNRILISIRGSRQRGFDAIVE